ncbi:MAG: serine/threonine protein kinase [Victivallales bacterium]|nr:serine/threonine protein kinase [Victivallales bacterium]
MEKDSNVPFLILLHEGVVSCPQCFCEIDDIKPFTVKECPGCELPLYMPLIIKNYVLYKPLGRGGEGKVYKALKRGGKERYAIKFFHRVPPADTERDNPFVQEGTAGAVVGNHPNLVPILDYGCEDDEYFIVFPLVEGERLDDYIKRKTTLSENRAFNIMVQIIAAERHICSKGYLYRDLKPENILIEKNGNVRMFDYGLCIPLEKAMAKNGKSCDIFEGSPFYIPPERVLGEPEGEFSEIYSLGLMLFHMLAGEPCFIDTNVGRLVKSHAEEVNFQNVGGRVKKCHPDTVELIKKMIRKPPMERFQTFQELKQAIIPIQEQLLSKPALLLSRSQDA